MGFFINLNTLMLAFGVLDCMLKIGSIQKTILIFHWEVPLII